MNNASNFTGKLFLILGPSGSGKGTVIKYLKKEHPEYIYPISHTTREMREKEINGEVYHFISKEEFKEKINDGHFLEWAQVHEDNFYGTDKEEIFKGLKEGKTIIREIDIQGAKSITKIIPKNNLVKIFISTKSWDELENRIRNRSSISDSEVKKRYQSYLIEIEYAENCDHLIYTIEGDYDHSNNAIEKIINSYQ